MRVIRALTLAFSLGICFLGALAPAHAQVTIAISVDVEPPPLPVYDQPPIPSPGYLWVPGYWAWDDDTGYYWVPGTWILPPEPELLWTPGYWGWSDGYYAFHAGYWGPQIGFYGGVAYGFGYSGEGYEGGYWRNGAFFYNRTVNNITNVSITNVYSKTVVVNNTNHVSFNGGAGGTTVRPTAAQLAFANQNHVAATAEQTRHAQMASKDPALSLANNHGHPTVAATAQPAVFKGSGVVAAQPGKPVAAVPPQGHSKIGGTTIPGSTVPAGTGAATGNKAGTDLREHKLPGATGTGTGAATGNKAGTDLREHKGPTGTGAATVPGNKASTEIREHKANVGSGNTGPGATPQANKLPSTVAHPPTPQVQRPPPPPPPRVAQPAPPRPAPPPPPRSSTPQAKPKCPPGQQCR